MAARIRSTVNGLNPLDEQSRNDIVLTDSVAVTSIDVATTYNWEIVFVPEGSTASFSGSATDVTPGSFTVDKEGPYLIKLTVDLGLATEDTQYVRLRALTSILGLHLVSAGEKRDATGTVPVDIDIEGWANEQNANLQLLEAASVSPRGSFLPYLVNVDATPNAVISFDGWVPVGAKLYKATVKMKTVNTVGNYTLDIINVATGNSCLSSVFDMNTLTAGTVTTLPLTGITSDLSFLADGSWSAVLSSDSASFNGAGVYVQLLFTVD